MSGLALAAVLCAGAARPAFGAERRPAQPESAPPISRWDADLESADADPTALDALRRALAPDAQATQRLELLRAAERTEDAPPAALAGLIAGVLDQPVDAETLIAALRALGRYQSREAASAVLRFARSAQDIHQSPELAREALRTLTRQTGRSDPAADVQAWERWFAAIPNDAAAWYRGIAAEHAERSARAAAAVDASDARLAALYRRLLVSLPEKDRDAVLAEMIRSDADEVRALGFDQTTRAVLNGVRPGPDVTRAAIARLADPNPAVRVEAADLLQKLDDPATAPAAVEALARESSPLPAASILRVLVKRPDSAALRDIAAWLDSVGPAFAPAVDAALALDRAGAVTDPDLVARVKDVLSSLPGTRHTPGSVELLARVGGVESVAPLMESSDPDIASAAARAAAESPAMLDRVLEVAARRAALFEPAVDALARHRPTGAGFASALSLPAPSTEKADTALTAYASALPPRELLAVCLAAPDLQTRERYAQLADAPRWADALQADPESRARLGLLLAETRLGLKNPGAALSALDAACSSAGSLVGPADPNATPNPDPPAVTVSTPGPDCEARFAGTRATALAWLGRVDEALTISRRFPVAPEPWFAALDGAADLPHAPAIVAAIRELFSTRLTPEQAARLDALTARSAR